MQVLEKILEEIKEAAFQEDAPIYLGDTEVDRYVQESVVKEIIRSHMDEMNDDWTPVESGLPEDREEVEVTIEEKTDEDGGKRYYTVRSWLQDGRWIIRQNPYEPRVIAWQPLSEPYKPKRDISAAGEHIMSRFMKVE